MKHILDGFKKDFNNFYEEGKKDLTKSQTRIAQSLQDK